MFLIVLGICMDFVVLVLLFNMVWQNTCTLHIRNTQYEYYCFIQFYCTYIRFILENGKTENSLWNHHFVTSLMFSISIQLAYRYWHNIQHVPYTIERKNQVKLLYHCGISKIIVFISIEIIYGVTHLKSTIKLKIILPFHLFSQQKRKLFSVSWFFFLGFSFLFCLISLIY